MFLAIAVVAIAVAAVAFGRSEGRHAVQEQQRGLLAARAGVDSRLLQPTQSIYDPGAGLQCLIYGFVGNPLGLELCFDAQGRLVESVDRRGVEHVSTLRFERTAAPFRLPPAEVELAVSRVPVADRQTGLIP